MTIKILNLYSGVGGNRLLWKDCEVTAIEKDKEIAEIYQDFFPEDKMIVSDVIEWLNNNHKEFKTFDFVWSSPPCTTHTQLQMYRHQTREVPDMSGIYGLLTFFKAMWFYNPEMKYIIENVQPWYKPLIEPDVKLGRHFFWHNFLIKQKHFQKEFDKYYISHKSLSIEKLLEHKEFPNFDLKETKGKDHNRKKRTIIRNLVHPRIAKYILEQSQIKENNKFEKYYPKNYT
jgi:DNA (cytosine-5)-methyltransferase 1